MKHHCFVPVYEGVDINDNFDQSGAGGKVQGHADDDVTT